MTNSGQILTGVEGDAGTGSSAIYAQSIGGGGGSGAPTGGLVAVPGDGGGGQGKGGEVRVTNTGLLRTYFEESFGIFAESVGGGGGSGGGSGGLVALGGQGGGAANGDLVDVDNDGNIFTFGANSGAIYAHSVGGGGGRGGVNVKVLHGILDNQPLVDMAGPAHQKGHVNAPFIGCALSAGEIEGCGDDGPWCAVVGHEDDDGVVHLAGLPKVFEESGEVVIDAPDAAQVVFGVALVFPAGDVLVAELAGLHVGVDPLLKVDHCVVPANQCQKERKDRCNNEPNRCMLALHMNWDQFANRL